MVSKSRLFLIISSLLLSLNLEAAIPKAAAIEVETALIKIEELKPQAKYPAEVSSAVQGKIISEVSGTITQMTKKLGEKVRRGESILYIRQSQYGMNFNPYAVRAPASGVLTRLPLALGDHVHAAQSIGEITDPKQILLQIEVPASDLPNIEPGLSAEFLNDGEVYQAKVKAVSPAVDSTTGTARTELEVVSANRDQLRVGTVGQLVLQMKPLAVITVPPKAIVTIDSKFYLRQIDQKNTVKLVPVKVGKLMGDKQIVTSGIEIGSEIVVKSSDYLKDGDVVKRNNPPPAGKQKL